MKLRLFPRIVLSFTLLAAGLLASVGILSYRSGGKDLEAAVISGMSSVAVEKEAALGIWFQERLDAVRMIAAQPDVVEKAAGLIAAAPASPEASSAHGILLAELQPHVDSEWSGFIELFVMEPEKGIVVASTRPTEERKSKAGHPYFDNGRTNFYLSPIYQSIGAAGPAMTVAVPLRAADGRVVAVLACRLDLVAMTSILHRRTLIHETEEAFLVNAEGLFVTQPLFIAEPVVLRRRLDTEAGRSVVKGNSAVAQALDYRGVPVIAVSRWISAYRLGLIVKVDQSEALAPVYAFRRSVILISGLALLAAACLGTLLSRTITSPLRALHDKVRRFGAGDGGTPLDASGDEVDLLTLEFDRMARVVLERTHVLSESQRLGHIGSWMFDGKGPIAWSEEMYRLYGVSPSSFTPTPDSLLGLMHPDDRPAMQAWIAACGRGGEPGELDFRAILPDGTTRFLRGRGEAVLDAGDAFLYMAGTAQDISERKLADEERAESQSRYRAIFEASMDVTYVLDERGNFVQLNPAFETVSGWPMTDWIGRSYSEFVHPDDVQKASAIFQKALAGERIDAGLRMRKRSGGHWEGELTISRILVNGVVQLLGVARDVTERNRVDVEQAKLVALLENSPDFIGMATLQGKPIYVNTKGRAMVGLSPDADVTASNIAEYFDDETAELLLGTAIPANMAGRSFAGEGKMRHFTTRALVPVHIHSFMVRHPTTGEPLCLATIQRDITDIRDAERKLGKASLELIDLSRLSGMAEIATSVLHNVGNVLNSVNVSADRIAEKVKRLSPASLVKVAALLREHAHDLPEFLARDPRGRELPGYLTALAGELANPQKDIVPEVASLKASVDHIREIVRMQQIYARGIDVLETVSLADLAEDAIRIDSAGFAPQDLTVTREYTPVPSFRVEKHKVLQILVNLLGNARKALDGRSGAESRLVIRVGMSGAGTAKVSVSDNGVGIAPENLNRIFQHGFTTRKDGHGFALHSGAMTAREMGGSLTASSGGPGQGAVFTLELPCRPLEGAA